MAIIQKHEMTEEDIKHQFITPALHARGWKDLITMETRVKLTDGRVKLTGNKEVREAAKKADYILYLCANHPIAVVEAKDNNHAVSAGLQQAIGYAQMLDVPFAFSSNGDAFEAFDRTTGKQWTIPLDQFPTPEALKARYLEATKPTPEQQAMYDVGYYDGLIKEERKFPRYFQRIAINRTVEAVANGKKRLLLVMATGTGKTYTAFQIVWRLLKSGKCQKILYLADRTSLIEQTDDGDFSPLKKVVHTVNFNKDKPETVTAYQVYFSLYQQVAGNAKPDENGGEIVEKYRKLFKPDFFDFVIVDECHRGSAKENSSWRKILEYFSSAAQLGMTATPKETSDISTLSYFDEPLYTYSLKQGIEDGFLAPFRVINVRTNISDGWRPKLGQRDLSGNEIEDRIYNNSDFDSTIVLQDRIREVAHDITLYLKSTNRMNKTIVFCPTEEAALRMRDELAKQNADMMAKDSNYVVRMTGSDDVGKKLIKQFIGVNDPYPVIATTSKLLTTGVDCKMTKLIVLDQMIGSMTEFKQIIGRGTRIREEDGKMSFTVMDFRNVSRLFADPDWDGPLEISPDFDPEAAARKAEDKKKRKKENDDDPKEPRSIHVIDRNGCRVEIIYRSVAVYDTHGKLLHQVSIQDYTKENLMGICPTLSKFITDWSERAKRGEIRQLFAENGIDLEAMKRDDDMLDTDDFDYLCHVAFDQKPLTRRERAQRLKTGEFLSHYEGTAREILTHLIDHYADHTLEDIEKLDVLKLEPFTDYGRPAAIANLFGGKSGYLQVVGELEQALFAV